MTYFESPLAVVMKGAVAGLAGTAAITMAMKRTPQLLQQLGLAPSQSPAAEAEKIAESAGQPTEKLAEKVTTGVLDRPIEEDARGVAGQVIHWGYGAVWGAFYGMVQGSFRWPSLVHGAVFGGLVGAVASTLVPAMRLTPPPTQQPMPANAMMMVYHLLYGWVTALTFQLLSRTD
jgi:hypothetical protein